MSVIQKQKVKDGSAIEFVKIQAAAVMAALETALQQIE
jgi:hypothetical protein